MRKLLKQANNDIFGILEFDNRVIYEPVVQAPDNDYYVRKNIKKEYANAGIPYRQMGILIQKML